MLHLPTVLLLHTTTDGRHYDWLLGQPNAQPQPGETEPRLWTARLDFPTDQWLGRGRFVLTELPPHRAIYLDYEGPISGDRGHVQPIDHGWHHPTQWTADHIVTDIHFEHCVATVTLTRKHEAHWHADVC